MTKKYDDPIQVEVGGKLPSQPVAFQWRGKRYRVNRLIKYWREAGQSWDPGQARDHEFFRVESEGGAYDLRFDRLAKPPASRSSGKGSSAGGNGPGKTKKAGDVHHLASGWRLLRVWD